MSTELAKRAKTLKDTLSEAAPEIERVIPRHLDGERLLKVAFAACTKDQKLLRCNARSVARAVIQAAEVGLEINSILGTAYLVPYKDNAQLIIGYRGMVELARRSGMIKSIEARAVFEDDTFDLEYGLEPKLRHVPADVAPSWNKLIGCYAIAHLQDGGYQFDYMYRSEIEEIRRQSKSAGGPWKTHPIEMAKKCPIRRMFKLLPISIEMQKAFDVEDETTIPSGPVVSDPPLIGRHDIFREDTTTPSLVQEIPPVQNKEPVDTEVVGETDEPDVKRRIDSLVSIVMGRTDWDPVRAESELRNFLKYRYAIHKLANVDTYEEVYNKVKEYEWTPKEQLIDTQ